LIMKHIGSNQNRRRADHYAQRAKKEHYPARSVYKLKEAQKKYRLIKKGDRVLDLGCSPGSWLLYAAEMTGKRGEVLGIDQKAVTVSLPVQIKTRIVDIFTIDGSWIEKEKLGNRFNVVLSDMAPATTGNKAVDSSRSHQLCEAALNIAQMVLIPGGSFFCKIFQGEEFKRFSDSVKSRFKRHKIFKPQSSRKESKEIFIMGMGFRGSDKAIAISK
jgi:23S rRNA (uridine2552-2'-O)-methyltransferase